MKTTQTNTETNNTKKEIFLTKEIREKLITDILKSQQKFDFIIRNKKEYPNRNYRNFLLDELEDDIYKIKNILINNKF
jgi:hypothetical protein